MTTYKKTSPYYLTSLQNGYLDVTVFRDLPFQTDDIVYTVTADYEFRPDLLAFDLYKDSDLWWVFAVRNPSLIKDPIFDLKAGMSIYLPKLSTIQGVLGN